MHTIQSARDQQSVARREPREGGFNNGVGGLPTRVVYRLTNIEDLQHVSDPGSGSGRLHAVGEIKLAQRALAYTFMAVEGDANAYVTPDGDLIRFRDDVPWIAEATLSLNPIWPRSAIALSEVAAAIKCRLTPADGGRNVQPSAEAVLADMTWRAIAMHRPAGYPMWQIEWCASGGTNFEPRRRGFDYAIG